MVEAVNHMACLNTHIICKWLIACLTILMRALIKFTTKFHHFVEITLQRLILMRFCKGKSSPDKPFVPGDQIKNTHYSQFLVLMKYSHQTS